MTSHKADQRADEFEEPDRESMLKFARMHVDALLNGTADVWTASGMEHLILETVGRRSGRVHNVVLPFWVDGDGHRVVIASNMGGQRDPEWFRNVQSSSSNPTVIVRTREGEFAANPEILTGSERESVWRAMISDRPFYADYQRRCERLIPVIRLPEMSGDHDEYRG